MTVLNLIIISYAACFVACGVSAHHVYVMRQAKSTFLLTQKLQDELASLQLMVDSLTTLQKANAEQILFLDFLNCTTFFGVEIIVVFSIYSIVRHSIFIKSSRERKLLPFN
jgi:hypothetical protein